MSVKLINQHVDDGSHLIVDRVHKSVDATPPVAGERYPADIVNLIAVLFPSPDVDFFPLLACLIQQLKHVVDMYGLFHLS